MNKLNSIKKACKITDNIFDNLIENWNKENFKTEKQVKDYLLKQMRQHKVRLSFMPIVSCSKTHHNIHQKPYYKLRKGFLVIDFGVKYNNYCSDMTRTIYLGKPSKKEKEIYNQLLNCQKRSIKNLKTGKSYKEIDLKSRIYLKNYKKYFIHALGHGIGKKIHEKPNVHPKSKDKVKIGDFITIEPGIYQKRKINIRIEDTIYISKKGPIVLTKTKKELVIINEI